MRILYTLASFAMVTPLVPAIAVAAPQYQTLLAHYPVRPTWSVAGVDYHVGVPESMKLLDAGTISRTGVSVNASAHQIIVSGNNVVLSGYDFSTHGGWNVYVEGQNDTIEKSFFQVGKNNLVPIVTSAGESGLSILHCTIDGGGTGLVGNPAAIWSLIDSVGTSLVTRYNWLRNAPQHIVEFRGGRLLDDHNLIDRVGFYVGAHVNDVQFNGGVSEGSIIAFNTVYNPQPVGGFPSSGEDLQVEAQLGSKIENARVEKNTVISTGPKLTASYLIALHQDAGSNLLQGVTVSNNFLDPSGAYGALYPNPTGSDLTFSHNVNLKTGRLIATPGS